MRNQFTFLVLAAISVSASAEQYTCTYPAFDRPAERAEQVLVKFQVDGKRATDGKMDFYVNLNSPEGLALSSTNSVVTPESGANPLFISSVLIDKKTWVMKRTYAASNQREPNVRVGKCIANAP